MSGRGTRGRGGRGGGGRGGQRGRGRGSGYSGQASSRQTGLNKDLGTNVFTYGTKGAADQMRTTWEKICQYVGTEMGEDIANELRNETTVMIDEPTHTEAIQNRHQQRQHIVTTARNNIQAARRTKLAALEAMDAADQDPVVIATLQNDIENGEFELQQPVPIKLTADEKTQYENEWRTYRNKRDTLQKHRGQAYSLVLGQCLQLLQDRMKQDSDWDTVKTSNDPLQLYRLIKKVVQGQTDDQYPFALVYDQLVGLFGYRQEGLTNAQWYEKFNT